MKILLSFIILFPFCTFSQTEPVQQVALHYMPQGNVIESLGNIGAKSTNSIISEIGASNPASIHDFKSNSVGFSYQYDTKINEAWLWEFGHSRIFNFIPQSIGLVIPKNNWRFGFSMNQVYNNEIDYGKLDATMVWVNDQGYLETDEIKPKRKEVVLKNSILASYALNNFIKNNDKLILGLQLNYNYLRYEQSISDIDKISKNTSAINFVPGIIYEFSESAGSKSRIGLYYESKTDLSKTFNKDSWPYELISIFPHKLHLGVYHPCGENWSYAANITYHFWNDVNENFKDQTELSAKASYKISKNLLINFGFFSTNKKYENVDSDFDFNNLSAIYLILGMNYKINNIEFNLLIGDSHLMSDKWRKQSVFKIGTGYSF